MVKIIKPGKELKFTKTCPICGCEFEYEVEDLDVEYNFTLTSYPPRHNRYIRCPSCGKKIFHDYISDDDTSDINSKIIYCSNKSYDCEECPNKPDLNHPVFGDSPCTLCPKMQPMCEEGEDK